MSAKIAKASILVSAVCLFLAGTAWSVNWELVEFSDEGTYVGGEVEFLPDGFILKSTGGDHYSGKIGTTYVYMTDTVSGDFTFEYTIVEHTSEPPVVWSKGGVMVAQEIDPETVYVFIQSTVSNNDEALNDKGTKLITRAERGGEAGPGSNGWTPLQWPVTYKIVRTGDLFTVSLSFDGGSTYQSIADPADEKEDNTTVTFQDPVYLGIALSGGEVDGVAATATAKLTNIMLNGDDVMTAVSPMSKLATAWADVKTH